MMLTIFLKLYLNEIYQNKLTDTKKKKNHNNIKILFNIIIL